MKALSALNAVGAFSFLGAADMHTYVVAGILEDAQGVLNFLSDIIHPDRLFSKLAQWFTDPAGVGALGDGATSGGIAGAAGHVYDALAVGAMVLVGVAGGLRYFRALGTGDAVKAPMNAVVDIVLRVLIASALLRVGFPILVFALHASDAVAMALLGTIIGSINPSQAGTVGVATGVHAIFSPLHGLAGGLLGKFSLFWVIAFGILIIIVAVFVIYIFVILIIRGVVAAFALALAPLCIAGAVYDSRNKFFQWWLETFASALLIPIIAYAGLGITAAIIAGSFPQTTDAIDAIAKTPATTVACFGAIVMGIGGLWFTTKMLHQLTKGIFQHHSAIGLLSAGLGAAALGGAAVTGAKTSGSLGEKFKAAAGVLGSYGGGRFSGAVGTWANSQRQASTVTQKAADGAIPRETGMTSYLPANSQRQISAIPDAREAAEHYVASGVAADPDMFQAVELGTPNLVGADPVRRARVWLSDSRFRTATAPIVNGGLDAGMAWMGDKAFPTLNEMGIDHGWLMDETAQHAPSSPGGVAPSADMAPAAVPRPVVRQIAGGVLQ